MFYRFLLAHLLFQLVVDSLHMASPPQKKSPQRLYRMECVFSCPDPSSSCRDGLLWRGWDLYGFVWTYSEPLKSTNLTELCQISLGRRWIRKSNKLTKSKVNPNGTPTYDKLVSQFPSIFAIDIATKCCNYTQCCSFTQVWHSTLVEFWSTAVWPLTSSLKKHFHCCCNWRVLVPTS